MQIKEKNVIGVKDFEQFTYSLNEAIQFAKDNGKPLS